MKRCTKCDLEKSLDEFCNDRSRKSGKHPWCKPCMRARRIEWYAKNRESNLAYQAEWREANPEKKKASDAAWREANGTAHREQQKGYRAVNREKRIAYFKAYGQAKKNDPQFLETRARSKARRRARIAGVEHTPYTRLQIWERGGGECRECRTTLLFEKGGFHIDHIVPIALGGPDIPANLQLLCPPCNYNKWAHLDGQIHLPV